MNRFLYLLLFVVSWLSYRVIQWRLRVIRVKRTLPVVPIVLHPWNMLRMFWPKKWQRYTPDWCFQLRKEYENHGTNITALIPLFGRDVWYVANAEAIVEMASNPNRYPKDLSLYSSPWLGGVDGRGVGCIWTKCTYDGGSVVANTSKNHSATLFRTKQSTRS